MSHRLFAIDHQATGQYWQPVARKRITAAKRSFATRRIDLSLAAGLIVADARPTPGDLVLARVDMLGQHRRLESPDGRRAALDCGDEILVVYGNRYAPDQFEAAVPESLAPCSLVAGGGIAAEVLSKCCRMKNATKITPLGLVVDADGKRLNTQAFAIPEPAGRQRPPVVVAIVGSSMNAGKTTTMASLVRGEAASGMRVGAAKITGTGSGGDLWSYKDAGAAVVLDFTDAGHPSTAGLDAAALQRTLATLVGRLAAEKVDIAFIEIADGLLFEDTANLVTSALFRSLVDSVVFAAGDAMGALFGATWLHRQGLPLSAISGALTASPLAIREVESQTDFPVVGIDAMINGEFLISSLTARSIVA